MTERDVDLHSGVPADQATDELAASLSMLSRSVGRTFAATGSHMPENSGVQDVLAELDKAGSDPIFENVMDTMMHQILSKSVLYTPVKMIRDRLPNWLIENEKDEKPEDIARYNGMLDCARRLCDLYENEEGTSDSLAPEMFERIMPIFQEMQLYGQPPSALIAPSIETDAANMPVLTGLPGGVGDCHSQ